MSSPNILRLPPKILSKFDIKNEMAGDGLISDQVFNVPFVYLECWPDRLHFLLHCVLPECVLIFVVDPHAIGIILWDLESVLVGSCPITRFCF